jgi:hypothetical protein
MANLFQNQDINSFYQTAIAKDFARQNLFRVLYINSGSTGIVFNQTDNVYVTSTALPSRAIKNIPVPFMGLQFNVPGTANYPGSDSWQITFRMPQDLSIRAKLELWTRGTFDDAQSTGAYEVKNLGSVGLALMGKNGQVLRFYNLVGAYCVNIGQYTLNTTTAGEIVEQQATIAYQYWIQPESSPLAVGA